MESAASQPSNSQPLQLVKDIIAAAQRGEHALAFELANGALARGLRHPVFFNARAAWYGLHGRYEEALADLEAARIYLPRDPMLLDAIGHCLTMLGRHRDAINAFDAAIAIAPDFAQAHYRKGLAHELLNELDETRRMHERVAALRPDYGEAIASLAYLAARAGDIVSARTYGARAIKLAPRNSMALIALAIADMSDGAFGAAKEKLDRVLEDGGSQSDGRVVMALGFGADAWDRHGRTSEAFALYNAVNARRRETHEYRFAQDRAIEDVQRLITYFERTRPWPAPALVRARHVFLLGFVRSGTTLLETILARHADIAASDEQDFLAEAAQEFLRRDEDLDRLSILGEAEAESLREHYWKLVRDAGIRLDGRIFLDKVPLNSLRLPLIARLFPDAKIILALRDPRDVVFSTFRHRFNMYPSSFEFLRLDDCARYYAAVMRLVEHCRNKLALVLCEHHYEDLLADFDSSMRMVCDFIGIPWSETLRDFQLAAGAIDRRSQSAAQVRRGLYQGANGQWRRYRGELAPVLPILEPWIERFGYDPD